MERIYDVAVVGGGPAGATAAADLAAAGHSVLLLDREGRIKPCGGAIPPVCVREFDIPESQLCAKVTGARMISPKGRHVPMPINGWVGMVNRGSFDEWLRDRAARQGATRRAGRFEAVTRDPDGTAVLHFAPKEGGPSVAVRARGIIGADGALSPVARQCVPDAGAQKFVFAYHEIIAAPGAGADYDPLSCDVVYDGIYSPDFYAWVFPHGDTASIGTGSAHKCFALRESVAALRAKMGLTGETIRHEGAPLPLKPLRKWDNGNDVLLAGDAAGCVAPASGEGIYYAMAGGRLAAQAMAERLSTGDARALGEARRRFMKSHGSVFWVLGLMQAYWYGNDWRRERFVAICRDADVQQLTWDAYMNKRLVRAKPAAHARIFFKNVAYLTGLAAA